MAADPDSAWRAVQPLPWPVQLHLAAVVGIYIVGVTWFARTEAKVSSALASTSPRSKVPPGFEVAWLTLPSMSVAFTTTVVTAGSRVNASVSFPVVTSMASVASPEHAADESESACFLYQLGHALHSSFDLAARDEIA